MEQQIYLIGLNYRTAGVEVRERFALTDHCSKDTWAIPLRPSGENDSAETTLDEALILSTCNRVEILAVGQGDVPGLILEAWASAKNRKAVELAPYVYIHKGREAIAHLFTVASSLDSMVLGEPQILGQLKGAYRKATLAGTTKTIINRLLHKSFSVAKRVRTETGIAASAVSISYAAVELAKRIFGDMGQYQAMLIGAGEMAELAATHLIQAGISNVKVANRTYQRAKELAAEFKGEAVPFEHLFEHLADVDIIISSTGSPEAIIRARDIKDVLKRRKYRPMFFIDIAVPRDIDPDVNNVDNVYLYDIDDLKEVVEENLAHRRVEAEKAQGILAESVGRGRAQEPALQIIQRPGMGMHMPAGVQGQRIDAQVTGGQIRRQAPTTERHEFTAVPQTDLNAFPHAGGVGMRRQKGGIVSVHGIIQLNRCLSQQDVTDGTANKVGLHDDIMP